MKQRLLSLLLFVLPFGAYAQNFLEMPVTVQLHDAPLSNMLSELEQQLSFNFSYEAQLIDVNRRVSVNAHDKPLKKVLRNTLGEHYDYKVVGTHVIIQSTLAPLDKRADKFTFSGQVLGPNNEPLPNAIVYEANRQRATFTSRDGYYQLNFRDKNHPVALSISHTGFRDTVIYVSNGYPQQVRIIPLPEQRIIPSDFSAMQPRVSEGISELELTSLSDITLAKLMVNKDALYVSNNLNVFNWQTAQISFVPYISTNSLMNGLTTNNVSLNMVGGYTAQIEGVEFGGVSNFIQNSVYGLQAAGVSNVVGKDVAGFQAAGITNIVARNVSGLQAAGISNMLLGNLKGAQASGIINHVKGHHTGVMAAGILNITEGSSKLPSETGINAQLAGIANIHLKDTSHLQVAAIWNQAEEINGLQISAIANYTNKLNGLQIGLVNIADTVEHGFPIGLINIVKHGYHTLELSTNETFHFNAAFKTGGNHLYSFLGAGLGKYIGVTYGIGYTTDYAKKISFNIDVSEATVLDPDPATGSDIFVGNIYRAQIGFNYHPGKKLAISFGPALNFLKVDTQNEGTTNDNQKAGGVYYGDYYLQKGLSTKKNQSWLGWHMSLRF